jgi:type III secretory pathway component EscS
VVRRRWKQRWVDSVSFRRLRMAAVLGAATCATLCLAVAMLMVIVGTVVGLLQAPAQLQTGSLPVYSVQIGAVLVFVAFDLAACLASASLVYRLAHDNVLAMARSSALLTVLALGTSTTASAIAAQKYSCGDEHSCGIAPGAFAWWDSAFNLTLLPLLTAVIIFVGSFAFFLVASPGQNSTS